LQLPRIKQVQVKFSRTEMIKRFIKDIEYFGHCYVIIKIQ